MCYNVKRNKGHFLLSFKVGKLFIYLCYKRRRYIAKALIDLKQSLSSLLSPQARMIKRGPLQLCRPPFYFAWTPYTLVLCRDPFQLCRASLSFAMPTFNFFGLLSTLWGHFQSCRCPFQLVLSSLLSPQAIMNDQTKPLLALQTPFLLCITPFKHCRPFSALLGQLSTLWGPLLTLWGPLSTLRGSLSTLWGLLSTSWDPFHLARPLSNFMGPTFTF